MLLVSSTFREAEELTAALQSLLGDEAVAYYPAWETLPHERLSPRSDTVGARLDLLHRIHAGDIPRADPSMTVPKSNCGGFSNRSRRGTFLNPRLFRSRKRNNHLSFGKFVSQN